MFMSVCWYSRSWLLSPALFQPVLMTLRKHPHPFMVSFIHPGDPLETGELSSVSVNSSLLEIRRKWNNTLMTFCVCLSSLGVVHSQGSGRWDFTPSHGQMTSIMWPCHVLSVHSPADIYIWIVHCDY